MSCVDKYIRKLNESVKLAFEENSQWNDSYKKYVFGSSSVFNDREPPAYSLGHEDDLTCFQCEVS